MWSSIRANILKPRITLRYPLKLTLLWPFRASILSKGQPDDRQLPSLVLMKFGPQKWPLWPLESSVSWLGNSEKCASGFRFSLSYLRYFINGSGILMVWWPDGLSDCLGWLSWAISVCLETIYSPKSGSKMARMAAFNYIVHCIHVIPDDEEDTLSISDHPWSSLSSSIMADGFCQLLSSPLSCLYTLIRLASFVIRKWSYCLRDLAEDVRVRVTDCEWERKCEREEADRECNLYSQE